MKLRPYLLVVLLVFPWLSGSAPAVSETGHALFFSANQDYRQGNFEAAAQKYESLVKSGKAGGDVYYNLGNACFRQNRIGAAILNYSRARLFMPRDPDLSFNLRFVLDKRRNPPDSEAEASLWGVMKNFTGREVFFLFAAANAALFLAFTLRIWVRREWTYYLAAACGIAFISAGAFAGAKYWDVRKEKVCVITASRVEVRSGPSLKDTALFILDEGALVHGERDESGFRLIRVNTDKRGWVPVGSAPSIRQEV